MPNWCNNHLSVTGPAGVLAFKQKAAGHSPWHTPEELGDEELEALSFHSLVPIPQEVLQAGYKDAGYNWERNNWGCKWGARHGELVDEWEGHIMYGFDTAWSPPIEFLETLAKQWPNLVFILEYEEPGIGFKGLAKFHGEAKENHCITC